MKTFVIFFTLVLAAIAIFMLLFPPHEGPSCSKTYDCSSPHNKRSPL